MDLFGARQKQLLHFLTADAAYAAPKVQLDRR